VELKTQAATSLIPAGKVADYALNEFRIIETSSVSIGVVRTKDGMFAVLNKCPHMGAPICLGSNATCTTLPSAPFEYRLDTEHNVVRCPLHRWEFRVDTGENVGGVTRAKVRTFPVEVHGEQVFVARGGPAIVSAEKE
jgi:3-phenylpropionate/trans-cinnamate dioxygenase ferredoxin subunit